MKATLISCLMFIGVFALAADPKPADPKAAAAAKPKIGKVPDVPATPPRITVESSPGAAYAMAFYENSQTKVSTDKIAALNACSAEVAGANLIALHSAVRSAYAIADQAAKDATLVAKDKDRDQQRVDQCQKAYDSDKKSAAKAKELALAKKDLGMSGSIRKKREDQAAAALATYTKALDEYSQALAGVGPAIDRFIVTAGFPKNRAGR